MAAMAARVTFSVSRHELKKAGCSAGGRWRTKKMLARPGEARRVAGAAQQEAPLRPAPCGLDEQLLQHRLPVRREGAEIGEVGPVVLRPAPRADARSGSTLP